MPACTLPGMRGDLSETTTAGACRSLATRTASGALLIDASDVTGLIRFREGLIVGVASPDPAARVGDRLVGAGILARSALDEVAEDQRRGSETRPLHRALVERGLVPAEAVDRVLRDRMLDALLELSQLGTGALMFLTDEELHAGGSPDDELAGPALEVDDALRAVAERQEELVELRRRAPDATVVPIPAARADDALDGEALDADATTILRQIDGQRSLEEIAVAVGYGVLEVTRLVDGLVSAGRVDLERAWDAIGDELDDAIRQLAEQPTPSDTASSRPAPSDTSSSRAPAADPSTPDDPASGSSGTPGDAGADDVVAPAAESPKPQAADETSVSWDDLFGGGDMVTAPVPADTDPSIEETPDPTEDPTTRPAPDRKAPDRKAPDRKAEPTTRPTADPAADPAAGATAGATTEPAGIPEAPSAETPTDTPRGPNPSPADPPPFFADTHRPQPSSTAPTSSASSVASGPGSAPMDEGAGPKRHDDHGSTGDDTDVSEFLRELSRLALGEDAPPTPRRSGGEPPAAGDTPRPAADQDGDRARRPQGPADSDHARRRRGFFGRG